MEQIPIIVEKDQLQWAENLKLITQINEIYL